MTQQKTDYEAIMVGTVDVPEADKLDETKLSEWLTANVEGYAGPLTLTKFKGGAGRFEW